MAKRGTTEIVAPPTISPMQGKELLDRQIKAGETLLARAVPDDAYKTWELLTKNFLEKAFGTGSPNVSSVTSVGKYGAFPMHSDPTWWAEHRAESLNTQLAKLRGLAELLQTESDLQHVGTTQRKVPQLSHRIFLVHGHDERVVQETARFLEKLELDVVILREQPNHGMTIIEKFEEYADVGFAVILLTPDDKGGTSATAFEHQRPRARQNVVFELGYFIGRLGRNRVCAVYRKGVEIPSDYSGILYHEFDENGAWRLALARELKAAGLAIDMNNAL